MSYLHTLLGRPLTWLMDRPELWDPTTRRMVTQDPLERTGLVWSAGPVTGTAWVIPDHHEPDDGHAVCVQITKTGHRQRHIDQQRSTTKTHDLGLAALRHRHYLPTLLARTSDNGPALGYHLARGA